MLYSSKRSPYWFCYIFSLALNYFVEKPQEQKKSPTEKIVSKSFSRSNQSHQPWQMYESIALWREENGAHSRAALIRVNSIRFSQFIYDNPVQFCSQKKSVNQVSDAISANRRNSLFVGLSFFCRKMLWSFQQVREKSELTGPHCKVDTSVRKFHWLVIIFCTNNLHLIYN